MPIREAPKHEILENLDELNLGNSLPVSTLSPPNIAPADFLKGQGRPIRILDVNGPSQRSRVMTIALSSFLKESNAGSKGIGGPVVASIEFGNGGALSTIEVDVPFGSAPSPDSKNPTLEDGVILSLPGSSFRVMARNDGNAVPVNTLDEEIDGTLVLGKPSIMQVRAWISYLPRSSIQAVRRLFPIAAFAPEDDLSNTFNIPAFSRVVRFMRTPQTTPIQYVFGSGQFRTLDTGIIPAGVSSPLIEVPTQANQVFVGTMGVPVSQVWGDYYLQA